MVSMLKFILHKEFVSQPAPDPWLKESITIDDLKKCWWSVGYVEIVLCTIKVGWTQVAGWHCWTKKWSYSRQNAWRIQIMPNGLYILLHKTSLVYRVCSNCCCPYCNCPAPIVVVLALIVVAPNPIVVALDHNNDVVGPRNVQVQAVATQEY